MQVLTKINLGTQTVLQGGKYPITFNAVFTVKPAFTTLLSGFKIQSKNAGEYYVTDFYSILSSTSTTG